jgi:hypothetical protein
VDSKTQALVVFLLIMGPLVSAQQLLWFGTATSDGRTTQCRFEILREGDIKTMVLAPYGLTPTTFQEVKELDHQLTFTWRKNQSIYHCSLLRINEVTYEGDCFCERRPSIRLTIRDFTKDDAILQGDSLHASQTDLKILDRALELLGDGKGWNKVDNRVCDSEAYPYKWSLFCALHQASIEIGSEYQHLRPAIQASRQAIGEFSAGKKYAHLLQDFNNEALDFNPIGKVLERAREIIKERIISHR